MFLKRIIFMPLAFLIICMCFTSCTVGKNRENKDKLEHICSWLENDFWKNSLCEFAYYNLKGTKTDGSNFNYDEMQKMLDKLFSEFTEHNTFVSSLEGEEYSDIKSIWTKIYDESVSLNNKIKNKEIAESANADFEVDSLYKYINELNVKVDKL